MDQMPSGKLNWDAPRNGIASDRFRPKCSNTVPPSAAGDNNDTRNEASRVRFDTTPI